MRPILVWLLAAFAVAQLAWLIGCAPVKQWERGYLADPMMTFSDDPIDASLHHLIYESREASVGGDGVSGGGCACSQ